MKVFATADEAAGIAQPAQVAALHCGQRNLACDALQRAPYHLLALERIHAKHLHNG